MLRARTPHRVVSTAAGSLFAVATSAMLLAACSGRVENPLPPSNTTAGGQNGATVQAGPQPAQLPPLGSGASPGNAAGTCGGAAAQPAAPAWIPPHPLRRNICTQQEALALARCHFAGQDCGIEVTKPCHACAVSATDATTSSAIIVDRNARTQKPGLNVEGCVAGLHGDVSAAGCGAKLATLYACEEQACNSCATDEEWGRCADTVDQGGCASSLSAAECATPFIDTCIGGTSDVDVAFNLVGIFCGP